MATITIIGTGKMAEAIIAGLAGSYETIEVVGRNAQALQNLASKYPIQTAPLENFDIEGKTVILAVKPYALEEVRKQLCGKAHILISILAGTSLEALRSIDAQYYARAMPNIAASKKASTTTIMGDSEAKAKALEIFEKIGKTIAVDTEKELDIATAIAGSGPAFLALAEEAIVDGGVACGLTRESAKALTKGLFASYAALADMHPAAIKESVMSPGGTTAAGIKALEAKAVRAAFIDAITAAYERTK